MAGLEGIRANVYGTDYYVSKTGLLVLTRALAASHATRNIRVNMISPGQLENSIDLPPLDQIGSSIPLGRAGSLQDVTQALEFGYHIDFGNAVFICSGDIDRSVSRSCCDQQFKIWELFD